MAQWKCMVRKYVTPGVKKDHWTCNFCLSTCTGHRKRMIAHLTRNPGNGIKVCEKITPEQVKELKRELGLGPHSTGADGWQPQQPSENDDIGQENGNKKRKSASGSGTSGSNQREAEMFPSIALNPLSAVGESISVSNGNTHDLQNLETSVERTGLQPGYLEQNSSFSEFGSLWDKDLAATAETSHDRGRAYVPNTDNGGIQGRNAVGSSGLPNITHQGQYSSSQGQVDHRNDQHIHPHTSTRRNAFGDEMAGEIVLADEPQPPCPPGFNPDNWKFYIAIDSVIDPSSKLGKFSLYERFISPSNEEDRKVKLGILESICSELKNELTDAPVWRRKILYITFLTKEVHRLQILVDGIKRTEQKVKAETREGVDMVVWRRESHRNRWLGYAARFKSDVANLKVEATKVRCLEDTLQLLSFADDLIKIGDAVIEAGLTLLNPVPDDISIWNPTYMSCGSQFVNQNQMPPIQFPPQV